MTALDRVNTVYDQIDESLLELDRSSENRGMGSRVLAAVSRAVRTALRCNRAVTSQTMSLTSNRAFWVSAFFRSPRTRRITSSARFAILDNPFDGAAQFIQVWCLTAKKAQAGWPFATIARAVDSPRCAIEALISPSVATR